MPPDRPGPPGDEFDDGLDGDLGGPLGPPLPPEDRLWRHPSEVAASLTARTPALSVPAAEADRRVIDGSRAWGLALVSGLVGATLTLGIVAAAGFLDRPATQQVIERMGPPVSLARQPSGGAPGDATDVARTIQPSVVHVWVNSAEGPVTGVGIVLDSAGHLLTTAQTVADASVATVRMHDGSTAPAEVLGVDDDTDLAVLVLRGDDATYDPVQLGTTHTVEVGESTIAVSMLPDGGDALVTSGIVSAVGQHIDVDDGRMMYDLLQTDAPLATGASSGLLFDREGTVVGVATTRWKGDLVYATPIATAYRVAKELIHDGEASHVWLGIDGKDRDGAGIGTTVGALVSGVSPGSPAETAGLLAGDVIVAIDGEPVASMTQLVASLRTHAPGDTIHLGVRRVDQTLDLVAVLVPRT